MTLTFILTQPTHMLHYTIFTTCQQQKSGMVSKEKFIFTKLLLKLRL